LEESRLLALIAAVKNVDPAGAIGSIRAIPNRTATTMMTLTWMKTKNVLLTIATVLAIASARQTEAGPEARTGLGTIIVYRPWSIIGSAMKFNLNHGPDLTVRNGTYYRLTVLPGDSIISHDDVPFIDEDEQTVHVEPGQTVYFQYMIALSLIFEEADNQEQAARTVSRLRPLN
jgi:hypothetical protein